MNTKSKSHDAKVRQLEKDFRRLQLLFTEILVSECFLPDKTEKKVELVPYDSNITCSYCRCNIFNRFLTCPNCVEQLGNGEEDTYDICMDCYAMGRSCACISKLRWVEQWSWGELTQKHEQWRHQILQYEGKITQKSPMSLKTELERRGGTRTLAQICQLELAKRPFRDIRSPPSPPPAADQEQEDVVGPDGTVKRKKIKRTGKFLREHGRCHTDCHWEPKWKQAVCTQCDKRFCFGTLFRRFDTMPQEILADPKWICPSCKQMCGCTSCRTKAGYVFKPYTPSGTLLGHNTKAIADPRSVESLVDFSISNIGWIIKADDDHGDQSRRLKKRRRDAEAAKANEPELGEHYVDGDEEMNIGVEAGIMRLAQHEGLLIDPALVTVAQPGSSAEEDDDLDENPESRQTGVSTPEGESALPYALPEGGVVRDPEHAYEHTEAITFDYPDPDVGLHVPVPVEEEPPAPPPAFAPAVPEEDTGHIGMIERKRKRAKIDDGDRPYGYKMPKQNLNKKKQRKSLIIKLRIPIDKLNEMEKIATIARQALKGVVEAPAPVISSDLQALNIAEGHSQAIPRRIRRTLDHIEVERDDEFMPGRSRARRKLAEGDDIPAPDVEVTRRQTRMHQMHYEEPSEDEFNEIVDPRDRTKLVTKPVAKPTNGVVRLGDAELNFDSTDDSEDEDVNADAVVDENSSASSPPTQSESDRPKVVARAATKAPKLTIMQTARSHAVSESPASQSERSTSVASSAMPSNSHESSNPASKAKAPISSQTLDAANANRRAKMALIESMDIDSDEQDGSWSPDDSFLDTIPAQEKGKERAPPSAESTSAEQSSDDSTQSIAHDAEEASRSPAAASIRKPISIVKASAADWIDSDDSDAEVQAATGKSTWVAINGGASRASRAVPARNNRGGPSRKRGRPSRR
jgi:hypothetical protein